MKTLQYKGLTLSQLAIGCDCFGPGLLEDEKAFALLDSFVAAGGTTLDTARVYADGQAEASLGRWLQARGNRDKVCLVTKGGHFAFDGKKTPRVNKTAIREDLEASLKALQQPFVDIYFLHRDDPSRPVGDIMEDIAFIVEEGFAKMLGASNWSIARIVEANEYAKEHNLPQFGISQIAFSLAFTTPESMGDLTLVCMNKEEYAGYQKSGIPVMAYASQGKGYFSKNVNKTFGELSERAAVRYDSEQNRARLTYLTEVMEKEGLSATQVTLSYLTSNPVSTIAIAGTKTPEHLADCLTAKDVTLQREYIEQFDRI